MGGAVFVTGELLFIIVVKILPFPGFVAETWTSMANSWIRPTKCGILVWNFKHGLAVNNFFNPVFSVSAEFSLINYLSC